MNKKTELVLILLTYAAIASIPSVLGYLQNNTEQATQREAGSCGSCHVDPNRNSSANTSLLPQIIKISYPNMTVPVTIQGTENSSPMEDKQNMKK